jgi:hypothetical protein
LKTFDFGGAMPRRKPQWLFLLLALLPLAGCNGCRESAAPAGPGGAAATAVAEPYRDELFTFAIENLNHVEEYEWAEVVEQLHRRIDPQKLSQPAASEDRTDTLLAAWPEPEMLRQIPERLNRWLQPQRPPASWLADPMVATLPKELAGLPQVKDLEKMEFSRFDAFFLREAVWLRDVGRWARGEALDDLERAKSLFDWTVRNIQLEPENPNRIPLLPWEMLLFGRGTATERAWLFILLARQSGIDATLLGLGGSARAGDGGRGTADSGPSPGGDAPEELARPWCIAVLAEGNAYLFDPVLGLPIPAPDGLTLRGSGELDIRPATLAQVIGDEKLLRRLDIDEGRAYSIKAADLKHLVALLEASPSYLAQRMKLLESRLAGEQKMVLTTAPSAQAERWKTIAHVAEGRLWLWPYEVLRRRSQLSAQAVQVRLMALLPLYAMPSAPLYRGRVLYLKGKFVGDHGAAELYKQARPSDDELRLSSLDQAQKLFYMLAKQDASYWTGLLAYQRGKYDSAIDYFRLRTLLASSDNPWIPGAQYNLARAYEASGATDKAIAQYGNASSPGLYGELLRAKWLKELTERKKEGPSGGS